ncbi:MAG TPA: ABC transporter substrate-binding protein [Patescibacteria group bacterium]|nr:ABC transporter substrate-binding protein [Patescibacteria group bacterium]
MSFWINFILTFFKRKKWLSLGVLLAVSILALSGYFYLKMDKQVKVKEGIVGTHEERDLPETVLNLISKPLIKIDKSGNPVPELIQSWEISNEGKVYRLKLKPDLSWSDGRKVKASEIYISIADVEITAPDDQTLEFKLAEAFSPFPTLLNKPILRKAPVEFGFELVGVGPYKVLNKKKDGPFVKKIDFDIADKSFPRVSVTFFPNEKIAKTALKLGEVQSLLGVIEPDDLNFNNLAKKELTNFNQLVTIFLNTEDPLLSDENLRLSLAYSAPEFANAEIARTSLSPHSWAFNPNVKDYLNNKTKALESLKKVEKGKDETITLTVTSSLKDTGEKVVEAWNNLGLKTVLRVESGTPQNFQALLITQNIPADPDQYSLWHSTQKDKTNISKIASPRIDKDLEDGRKNADPEVRKQKYQDFQKILLDQAPAIFLYFPKYEVVYMKKIGVDLDKVLPIQLVNLN